MSCGICAALDGGRDADAAECGRQNIGGVLRWGRSRALLRLALGAAIRRQVWVVLSLNRARTCDDGGEHAADILCWARLRALLGLAVGLVAA